MNAKELIDELLEIAEINGVNLEDVKVVFREDYESYRVLNVNIVDEGSRDSERSEKLVEVVLLNDDKGIE